MDNEAVEKPAAEKLRKPSEAKPKTKKKTAPKVAIKIVPVGEEVETKVKISCSGGLFNVEVNGTSFTIESEDLDSIAQACNELKAAKKKKKNSMAAA
jgi:hypothetical protein